MARFRSLNIYNTPRSGLWSFINRFKLLLALCVICIGFYTFYKTTNIAEKAYVYTARPIQHALNTFGFTVKTISVVGNKYADTQTILNLSDIQTNQFLFNTNTRDTAHVIQTHPWVNSVSISRNWPDRISIIITEHQPAYLYKNTDRSDLVLMSEHNHAINTSNIMDFKDLPMISGKGSLENSPNILKLLKKDISILNKVDHIVRIENRRWDIHTHNDMTIKLPEHNADKAITTLISMHKTHQLLDKALMVIDLRDPSRMIIKTLSGEMQNLHNDPLLNNKSI